VAKQLLRPAQRVVRLAGDRALILKRSDVSGVESPLAAPVSQRKKSYHSIVVPIRLAKATDRIEVAVGRFDAVTQDQDIWLSRQRDAPLGGNATHFEVGEGRAADRRNQMDSSAGVIKSAR
jgi:hypothetical protein